MRNFLVRWGILAVATGLAIHFVPEVTVTGGILEIVGVALVFGLITAILGPILKVLTLPIMVATLGLFSLVINFGLFLLTSWLMPTLDVNGLWPAFVASVIISVVAAILGLIFKEK
jgi:putative membrane protein